MNREDIILMAREAGITEVVSLSDSRLSAIERFAALVRADERNSWPAEMEAMERQVNILTDALAQASKDAARYQVLRTWDLGGYDYGLYSPEEVDKAIDDCIKEQP